MKRKRFGIAIAALAALTAAAGWVPGFGAESDGKTVTAEMSSVEANPPLATFAIVIGISRYKSPKITPLEFADMDAEAFAEFLTTPAGGNVPWDNIKKMTNENASAMAIKSAIGDWLPKAAYHKDHRVIIFFSGHGIIYRSDGYLFGYDTDPDAIFGSGVRMKEDVKNQIDRIEAGSVIFISDACHSGAAFETPSAVAMKGDALGGDFLSQQLYSPGRAILSASSGSEQSLELDKYRHGLFTYHLLQGLNGGADENGDGLVSIPEAHKYCYDKTSADAAGLGKEQHPRMEYRPEAGVIYMAYPGRAAKPETAITGTLETEEFETRTRLKVVSVPPGAEIYFKGKKRGTTPGEIEVGVPPSGVATAKVEIRLAGYDTWSREVAIEEGGRIELQAVLDRESPQSPSIEHANKAVPANGIVFFKLNEEAALYVDGKKIGSDKSFTLDDLPAGAHAFRFEKQGYETNEMSVSINRIGDAEFEVSELQVTMRKSMGSLHVTADRPGVKVYWDGEYVGKTPIAMDAVSIGSHVLRDWA